mmetsp:Transcript_4159/g.4568  ORF Transcript_4159/g.4568 Transcript_4159/m.4568 type:complete len:87 (+) Transcript_4159:58-318(+)
MSKRARQILFGPTKTIGDEKKMIFRFKINKQCPTYFCKNGWRHRNPSWEFRNDAYLTRRDQRATRASSVGEARMQISFIVRVKAEK